MLNDNNIKPLIRVTIKHGEIMKGAVLFLTVILMALNLNASSTEGNDPWVSATFNGLKFRCIGPAVTSGRIGDFAVNPENPAEYYVAVASGNVWKTDNGGTTFQPVFDDEGSYSIGCITMDPSNHNVIWVGTGENNSQRSVSYGDGVYKSEDGGKSWKHMGLRQSEHIAKILIDPRDSDVVFVASQGPLWGPGGERGLYKSVDGGKSWELILEISENTGVTDIVMDPRDPDVIYAASYQRRRRVWTLINGGPESAIYKTTDGGENWEKLESGLPNVDMGRIGLAVSPAEPDIVYAIIEAADDQSGFYRSIDRGASWEKRSDHISGSPQYYQEIVADPKDPDRVYSLNIYTMVTTDGGKTFEQLGRDYRHVDDHALWIDPDNTDYLLIGGDGGVYESYDVGKNWRFMENLPITQFYRVSVDNDFPFYNVYGGTQDNFSLGGPSRTTSSVGIVNADWYVTKGGDGFETQVDPENPDIVYSQSQYGWLTRYDRKSGENTGIKPIEGPDDDPLRWNWDSPLIISPHSNTRLYFASNKLFRSDDRGNSWTAVSGDLTRRIDRNKLKIMDRVWSVDAVSKNRSTSLYGNIVALTESPLKEGLIYAGTDDGLIQVTEDGGENWRKIEKVSGVPEMTYVSFLMASSHDAHTVYAAFDNHKNADFKPYIAKSTDRGNSWKGIAESLPDTGTVYAIVEDHEKPDLLFAGTEFGVFFTIDGGEKWIQLKSGVPTIAVKDIAIQERENDLVLGTFGRSFYILDDYSPLRHLSAESLEQESMLFPVKDAWMYIPGRTGTNHQGASFYAAENPQPSAVFTYYLKDKIKTRREIRKEKEKELIEKNKPVPYPSFDELRLEDQEEKPYLIFTVFDETGNAVRRLTTPAGKGINRIQWDLRYSGWDPIVSSENNGNGHEAESGLLALPGMYSVVLSKYHNGKVTELNGPQKFEARVLGIATLPAEDREAQVQFQKKVAGLSRAVSGAVEAARELDNRIKLLKKAFRQVPGLDEDILSRLRSAELENQSVLTALTGDKTISMRNENQLPSISSRVGTIVNGLWRSTSAPTQTAVASYDAAGQLFKPVLEKLRNLYEVELKQIEEKMEKASAPWTPGRVPLWKDN